MDVPRLPDGAVVRALRPAGLEAARRVATMAFNENALGWYGPDAPAVVVETGKGEIAAVAEYGAEAVWWGGQHLPGAFVGGVATHPEHRRKGYAAALMQAAIHEMRAAGAVICHLWPFSFRYYRKLGWELPAPDLRIFLRPQDLEEALARVPVEVRVRPAAEDDAAALKAAHDRCAQQYNGLTVRSVEWFAERLKDYEALLALDGAGQPLGYTLYRSDPHPAAGGQRRQCRESLAAAPPVLVALLREVAWLPETAQVIAELPGDSPLPHVLAERPTISVHHCLQARVLDPVRALNALQPPASLMGRVTYAVQDPIAAADRPVGVEAELHGGHLQARDRLADDALRCSIQTFTRLFCGGMRAGEARAMGWLEGGSAEMDAVSDALLFRRRPYRSGLERG